MAGGIRDQFRGHGSHRPGIERVEVDVQPYAQGLKGRDFRRDDAGRQPNRIGPETLVAERFGAKHGLAMRRVAQGVCGRGACVGWTGCWPSAPGSRRGRMTQRYNTYY